MIPQNYINKKNKEITDFVNFASSVKDPMYPNLGVGCSEEEYQLMFHIVNAKAPCTVLELGCGFGASGYVFLKANDTHTSEGNGDSGRGSLTQVDLKNKEEAQYLIDKVDLKRVAYNQMKTTAFFPIQTKYDVIFIDADHSCEAVNIDLNNAYNALANDGIILMHDTLPTCLGNIGIIASTFATKNNKQYFELKIGNGLGVIY